MPYAKTKPEALDRQQQAAAHSGSSAPRQQQAAAHRGIYEAQVVARLQPQLPHQPILRNVDEQAAHGLGVHRNVTAEVVREGPGQVAVPTAELREGDDGGEAGGEVAMHACAAQGGEIVYWSPAKQNTKINHKLCTRMLLHRCQINCSITLNNKCCLIYLFHRIK